MLRPQHLRRLSDRHFDVLIVGGGATGAACARDAALRGLSVALCEHGDFACATSSSSSKLLHGGLRYLQHMQFPLVFEGLRERRVLMQAAPHLCRPTEFVFPAYRKGSHSNPSAPSVFKLWAGVNLYHLLALGRPPSKHRHLGKIEEANKHWAAQLSKYRELLNNAMDADVEQVNIYHLGNNKPFEPPS